MREPDPPALWRLPLALVLVAAGIVFARLGFRTETMLALSWAGGAVLLWVLAAALPPGPLRWRPRGGWQPRAVVSPIVLGLLLGVLLSLGGWLLSVVGMAESVDFLLRPLQALPWYWVLLAALALAFAEELALRHGIFTLAPRPARLLGTMALSVIAWLIIGNEVSALGAIAVGLAAARQRHVTGSPLAPVLTHVVTAVVVVGLLPVLAG